MTEFNVGDQATRTFTVTRESVDLFVRMTGDSNPIHVDDEYAKSTRFGRCIAPGMQVASYISAVLANDLPGPGTIYIEQTLRFIAPVFIDDVLDVTLTLEEFPREGHAKLRTTCTNQSSVVVVDGSARVKLPSRSSDGK